MVDTSIKTQHFVVIRGSFHASCTTLSVQGTRQADIEKAIETQFQSLVDALAITHELFLEVEHIELNEEPQDDI